MKKIVVVVLSLIIIISNLKSQEFSLVFTANNNCEYVSLDSILIKNLSLGCDTILYYPDTVLNIISSNIDIISGGQSEFYVSQNYPNPFETKTNIDVFIPERNDFTINVYDLTGRKITGYQSFLEAGKHNFTFYAGNSSIYIMTVMSGQNLQYLKMFGVVQSDISPHIKYNSMSSVENTNQATVLKQKSIKSYFSFFQGDELKFTGFIDGEFIDITDNPTGNKEYNFNFSHPVCPETYTDYRDGYIYKLVKIGCQCWLAENLRFLPSVTGASTGSLVYEHYYVYGYNGTSLSNATSHANFDTYGVLYNWAAVMQGAVSNSEGNIQGVCPDGWLIPNDNQWKELEMYLGMSKEEADNTGYRGTNEGSKLAGTTPLWASGYITANHAFGSSGFNGLPGGGRYITEDFNYLGASAVWWTSTDYATEQAWVRTLNTHYSSKVYRTTLSKDSGFSVRCVMK